MLDRIFWIMSSGSMSSSVGLLYFDVFNALLEPLFLAVDEILTVAVADNGRLDELLTAVVAVADNGRLDMFFEIGSGGVASVKL